MPAVKRSVTLKLWRGMNLSLDVEAGLTGAGAFARRLRSRLKASPTLQRTAARLQGGAPQIPLIAPSADGSATPQKRNGRVRRSVGTRAPERSSQDPPIFFVTGLGKSGTSWLMKTLDSHPEVMCRGEGRFFSAEWQRAGFDPANRRALASSLYHALTHSELLRLWVERSIWSRDGDPDEHLDALMRLATEHFMLARLPGSGKRFVGDKSPLLDERFVAEVAEVYPGAKVIHIVRDGRDQAVSMMHHVWNRSTDQGGVQALKPGEAERREVYREDPQRLLEAGGMFVEERLRQAAQSWNLRAGKTSEDGPALLGPNYIEVRYEDLLERPHEQAGRLFDFLGADAGEKTVGQAVGATTFEKLSDGRERGQEDSSSFYRKGVAGDWKNYFTERDKEIYKEEAGGLLIRLGYEKDDDW